MINLYNTVELVKEGLKVSHEGKRLLLSSKKIYQGGQILDGESKHLW